MNLWKKTRILGFLVFVLVLLGLPNGSRGEDKDMSIFASRIIDHDVYDGEGKLLGEVDDLIIRRSGKVKKMTIEFGGFLDIGGKRVALNFKRSKMKEGKIFVDVTKKDLRKRPEYDYYVQGLRPEYYFRARPYARSFRYPPPPYFEDPDKKTRPEPYEWALSPSRFLASVVMDRRLINKEGKNIGRVKDLIIDMQDNRVEKILVLSEDVLGKAAYVALSYEPLGFTAYGLVYDISPSELKDFIFPYKK